MKDQNKYFRPVPAKKSDNKAELPAIPQSWSYPKSIEKIKPLVFNWKKLTVEIGTELYIAREILSNPGARTDTNPKKETWRKYCREIGLEERTVYRWIERFFPSTSGQMSEGSEPIPLPQGQYDIIYADPPWKYDFSETESRSIDTKYPSLDLDEIKYIKVPSADSAVLFLWATAPKLVEALEVMSAWGFIYKTNAIWDKEIIGMGYWFRGRHEQVLVGVKGDFSPPTDSLRVSSVYIERREEHSKKPDYYYQLIENMFPRGTYLELFARRKRNGWTSWGNEIG